MTDEIQRALGRIEGQLSGVHQRLDAQHATLDQVKGRLCAVETHAVRRGARKGGEFGAYASVGVALLAEGLRQMLGLKPGG